MGNRFLGSTRYLSLQVLARGAHHAVRCCVADTPTIYSCLSYSCLSSYDNVHPPYIPPDASTHWQYTHAVNSGSALAATGLKPAAAAPQSRIIALFFLTRESLETPEQESASKLRDSCTAKSADCKFEHITKRCLSYK